MKEVFETLTPNKWLYHNLDIKNIEGDINLEIKADGGSSILISEPFLYIKT